MKYLQNKSILKINYGSDLVVGKSSIEEPLWFLEGAAEERNFIVIEKQHFERGLKVQIFGHWSQLIVSDIYVH